MRTSGLARTALGSAQLPLVGILVLAAVSRLAFLEDLPYRVDGDASCLALRGVEAWQTMLPILGTGWSGFTNFAFYVYGTFVRLAGGPILGPRLLSASGGVASVLAVYLLARQHFGKRAGLLSAFLLALLPMHLVFSRDGLDNVWSAAFATLSLFLLPVHPVLSGAIGGFSQYFYAGSRLIPVLLILYLLIRRSARAEVARVAAGFLLVYVPMIVYYTGCPSAYFSRMGQVGIWQSGESLTARFLALHAVRSLLAFVWPVHGVHSYYLFEPYLGLIAGILFGVGVVICARRMREQGPRLLLGWLVVGTFLSGIITIPSPTPNRFVLMLPPAAILAGVGLERLSGMAGRRLSKAPCAAGLAILLALYAATSLRTYWLHDTAAIYTGDDNTHLASFAGRYIRERGGAQHVYLLGDPSRNDSRSLYYRAIPTLPLLAGADGEDVPGPISAATRFEPGAVFLVLPDRLGELDELTRRYPGASVLLCSVPSYRFVLAIVDPAGPRVPAGWPHASGFAGRCGRLNPAGPAPDPAPGARVTTGDQPGSSDGPCNSCNSSFWF